LTHYIWKLLEAAIFDHKINLDLDYVVSLLPPTVPLPSRFTRPAGERGTVGDGRGGRRAGK